MAKDKSSNGTGQVYDGQQGAQVVGGLENSLLSTYLETYEAQLAGYRINSGDSCHNVTLKLVFPPGTSEGNAGLWAWFISKAAHPSAVKPRTRIYEEDDGVVVYVTWPIWKEVRYMESKNASGSGRF